LIGLGLLSMANAKCKILQCKNHITYFM